MRRILHNKEAWTSHGRAICVSIEVKRQSKRSGSRSPNGDSVPRTSLSLGPRTSLPPTSTSTSPLECRLIPISRSHFPATISRTISTKYDQEIPASTDARIIVHPRRKAECFPSCSHCFSVKCPDLSRLSLHSAAQARPIYHRHCRWIAPLVICQGFWMPAASHGEPRLWLASKLRSWELELAQLDFPACSWRAPAARALFVLEKFEAVLGAPHFHMQN